jgi:hypothetical protein
MAEASAALDPVIPAKKMAAKIAAMAKPPVTWPIRLSKNRTKYFAIPVREQRFPVKIKRGIEIRLKF